MKVIVAVDDSPNSARVISNLLRRHWPDNIEFVILTVLEPICAFLEEDAAAPFSDTLLAIGKRRQRAAKAMVERLSNRIRAKLKQARVVSEVRQGLPPVEIVNAAVDRKADLVLVGAHSTDVCPKNLMGSVSRAVVNHAPCTVEVVRIPVREINRRQARAEAS